MDGMEPAARTELMCDGMRNARASRAEGGKVTRPDGVSTPAATRSCGAGATLRVHAPGKRVVEIPFDTHQSVAEFRRAMQCALPNLRMRDFHILEAGGVLEAGLLSSHGLAAGDHILLVRRGVRNSDLRGLWRDGPVPEPPEAVPTHRRARSHSVTRYGKSPPCPNLPLFML
jgi:hypothetical protein